MTSDGRVARAFLAESRRLLRESFLPRIVACLERLEPDDLAWRPHPDANSVGVLVHHMCGNARQWVVAGVGGAPDRRVRHREFERTGPFEREALIGLLRTTVKQVAATLEALDPAEMERRRSVQGQDVTGLQAIYHAVEHFSMHTGQILYVTKLRTGEGLGFYRVDGAGVAEPTW